MTPMTINQCAKYYKDQNPNTTITASALRRLVASGAIRSCKIGVKYIITLEAVEEYFSGRTPAQAESADQAPGIRRLSEKIPY